MSKNTICLASDNCSPAHPLILKAIIDTNHGSAPSYGSDPWTEEATQVLQTAFNAKCKVFFIPTGTGSNVFALKLACHSYESVLCSDIAHIVYQETGAAEAIIGCKLVTIPHENGKLSAESLPEPPHG